MGMGGARLGRSQEERSQWRLVTYDLLATDPGVPRKRGRVSKSGRSVFRDEHPRAWRSNQCQNIAIFEL